MIFNFVVHNRKTSSEMVGFFYVHPYYTDGPGINLCGKCQNIFMHRPDGEK